MCGSGDNGRCSWHRDWQRKILPPPSNSRMCCTIRFGGKKPWNWSPRKPLGAETPVTCGNSPEQRSGRRPRWCRSTAVWWADWVNSPNRNFPSTAIPRTIRKTKRTQAPQPQPRPGNRKAPSTAGETCRSSDRIAGSQYWRNMFPIGVWGPIRQRYPLSAGLSMVSFRAIALLFGR